LVKHLEREAEMVLHGDYGKSYGIWLAFEGMDVPMHMGWGRVVRRVSVIVAMVDTTVFDLGIVIETAL